MFSQLFCCLDFLLACEARFKLLTCDTILHIAQRPVWIVQLIHCTVYTSQCTAKSTLHTGHELHTTYMTSLYATQCTLRTSYYLLHNVHCSMYGMTLLSAPHCFSCEMIAKRISCINIRLLADQKGFLVPILQGTDSFC